MTVKELIEKLQKQDQDAEVLVFDVETNSAYPMLENFEADDDAVIFEAVGAR